MPFGKNFMGLLTNWKVFFYQELQISKPIRDLHIFNRKIFHFDDLAFKPLNPYELISGIVGQKAK